MAPNNSEAKDGQMDAATTRGIPQLKNIEQVSEGWINKYILTYELPDGTDYVYESTSRKKLEAYRTGLLANARGEAPRVDAVCIVGETREGTLLMIREFRYPLNSWCIAFPAGLKEPNESIRECVDRELREETGYRLRTDVDEPVRLLPQAGFSSTGLTDEAIQIVFAQVEKAGDAQPEESELIRPFNCPSAMYAVSSMKTRRSSGHVPSSSWKSSPRAANARRFAGYSFLSPSASSAAA